MGGPAAAFIPHWQLGTGSHFNSLAGHKYAARGKVGKSRKKSNLSNEIATWKEVSVDVTCVTRAVCNTSHSATQTHTDTHARDAHTANMENFKMSDEDVNKFMAKHAVDEEVMIAAAAFPLPPAKLIQLTKVGGRYSSAVLYAE